MTSLFIQAISWCTNQWRTNTWYIQVSLRCTQQICSDMFNNIKKTWNPSNFYGKVVRLKTTISYIILIFLYLSVLCIFRIARDGDKNEIIKLLSLILGCAVTCRFHQKLKGTVCVFWSDFPSKVSNARFTLVPFRP